MPANSIQQRDVNAVLRPFATPEYLRPILLFLVDASLVAAILWMSLRAESTWAKILWSIPGGLMIGILFVIGHDACHGSLTPSRWLNRLLGTLAFLPSLHSFTLWDLGHNRIHHRFTNLKTVDYVFRPLSPEEYRALPWAKRLLYRIERSPWGHGVYYFRIWITKMVFPLTGDLPRTTVYHWMDTALLVLFAAVFSFWCVDTWGWRSFLLGPVAAFLFWNHVMGFVIYLHHTDPTVTWYKDEKEWEFTEAQLAETTHVRFPKPMNLLLHHILEHTAHHLRPMIPLYRLGKAQAALERAFPSKVKVIDWTPTRYIRSTKVCKLYDFDNKVWLDFDGRQDHSNH